MHRSKEIQEILARPSTVQLPHEGASIIITGPQLAMHASNPVPVITATLLQKHGYRCVPVCLGLSTEIRVFGGGFGNLKP